MVVVGYPRPLVRFNTLSSIGGQHKDKIWVWPCWKNMLDSIRYHRLTGGGDKAQAASSNQSIDDNVLNLTCWPSRATCTFRPMLPTICFVNSFKKDKRKTELWETKSQCSLGMKCAGSLLGLVGGREVTGEEEKCHPKLRDPPILV